MRTQSVGTVYRITKECVGESGADEALGELDD